MKVGTWNLDGRWTPKHEGFLGQADCDVWLLTEVDERVELDGYQRHLSDGFMADRRHWAGILSRLDLTRLPDPHPASAAAHTGATTFCSTILPWRSCGQEPPWHGTTLAEKTAATLAALVPELRNSGDLVWAGDSNHALDGDEGVGSYKGRSHVLAAIDELGLMVPTATLPSQVVGHLSIDHIAIRRDQRVSAVRHLDATGLSDHDAYVVDLNWAADAG
jgi:hypothetical protein